MTDPTPVSLPVWESMVADYGDPLADLDAGPPAPRRQDGLPPVPAPRPLHPPTAPLPLPGRGATALTLQETT